MARTATFEVFQGDKRRDGKPALWYYRRKAANGKITDPSQGYTTASNARRAIRIKFGVDAKIKTLRPAA